MTPTQQAATLRAVAEARALAADFDFPTVVKCRPWSNGEQPGTLAVLSTRGPKAHQVLAVFVPEVGA